MVGSIIINIKNFFNGRKKFTNWVGGFNSNQKTKNKNGINKSIKNKNKNN
jgi:hypothetical protein